MTPPHSKWLANALSIGFTAAFYFAVVLGCSGLLTLNTPLFPWIEAVALLLTTAAGITTARGSWLLAQERFRIQHNLCLRCGYPHAALRTPVCPECGKPFRRPTA